MGDRGGVWGRGIERGGGDSGKGREEGGTVGEGDLPIFTI